MTAPVRVALVGLGAAGRQHAAAINSTTTAALCAVCDAEPGVAAGFAATLTGDAPHVLDWPRVLADPDIEVIALCTPPAGHPRLAADALAAGKAVLLEKPPVLSEAELDATLAAATRAGRPVSVMLQHRFRLPEPVLATPWSGDAVGVLEVVRHRPPQHYEKQAWRLNPDASGGGLFAHLAVHYGDLACQLLGNPEAVAGTVECQLADGIDTRLALEVRFASGARLALAGTTAVDARGERLAVYDHGRYFALQDGAAQTRTRGEAHSWPAVPTPQLRAAVYAELCAAVRDGIEPARTALSRSRGVVRLIESVRRLAQPSVGHPDAEPALEGSAR